MIELGPFLVFLAVVGIVVCYLLIVRTFIREAEGQPTLPERHEMKASPPSRSRAHTHAGARA